MGKPSVRKAKKAYNKYGRRNLVNKVEMNKYLSDPNNLSHAKVELFFAGYTSNGNNPDKWMRDSVLELLAVLSTHGHSGHSVGFALSLFQKLANNENLTPLTLEDDEFVKSSFGENNVYQNIRDPRVFKEPKGIHNTDAFFKVVYKTKAYDSNEIVDCNKGSWSGTAYEMKNGIATGRCFRKCYYRKIDIEQKRLPVPNVRVHVTEVEIAKDSWIMFVDVSDKGLISLKETHDIDWIDCPKLKGVNIINVTPDHED